MFWTERVGEPMPPRLPGQRSRCRRVLRGVGTHRASVGSKARWLATRSRWFFDKGTAALDNTVQLEEAGVGWISALPWNQAPAELRERATEELPPCSAEQPGVRRGREAPGARPGISRRW